MQLELTEHIVRIAVVRPLERVDAFTAPQLRERLDALSGEGTKYFVIDLSATPFMDSAGMAALVSLLKRARQAGGEVVLVWPTDEAARRVLHLTKFDRVFPMFDDVQSAVNHL
ncbi:MAG: STAS domain-containing protein [Chloroflexales bacterium]